MIETEKAVSKPEFQAKTDAKKEKTKGTKGFETGIAGLDDLLGGGIRWGCSLGILSDLIDREILLHQIVENALKRGVYVYYTCIKEAPERIRLSMNEMDFNAETYEKKGQLCFYTPLETEATRRLKNSGELIKEFDKFASRLMRTVTFKVIARKQVLLVFNSYSAIYAMMHEDPKWTDFISKDISWLRRLVKVVSIGLADLKDQTAADAFNDFCIQMENLDGIPYLKATKVSSADWVPYRSTPKGIEIADEFMVR
ncbi:MAG TPA: ATPase domain-containing protein [Candidatus Bathyarchaeia archaeon]|nr:ATPase domain-containing protein [Candidatus Bathyarchaeia archaeon]